MVRLQGAVGGETFGIEIEPGSGAGTDYEFLITGTDGARRRFNVRVISRTRNRWTLNVDGAIHDLVVSRYNGRILVDWDNRNYQLSVADPREQSPGARHSLDEAADLVTAPMAGRVISVNRGPGDRVAAGESLVTLEAMKMLNQIKAPRAATIRKCAIEPGKSVRAGEILFELE